MPRLPLLIGVILLLAATARAEPAEELYQRAFEAITFEEYGPLQEAVAAGGPLPAEAVGMVEGNVRAMELAVGAIGAEFGGWPLDESQGFAAEMPWIGDARPLSALLSAGARYAAERGDPVSAAELLAANLRFGERIGTSPAIVAELVEVGIAQQTVDAARHVLPALADPQLRRLRGPVEGAMVGLDMEAAARGESEMMLGFLRRAADLPAEASAAALVDGLLLDVEPAQFARSPAGRQWRDRQERTKLLEGVEEAYATAFGLFDVALGDERERRQGELDRRLDADEFGWLAGVMIPSIDRAAEAELRARVRLAMLRAALVYRLDGEAGLRDVPDPATGEPFDLREEPGGGFTLAGGLEVDGEPITLTVR